MSATAIETQKAIDGFTHHVMIGTLPDVGKVFVTIRYTSDGRLSVSGVEGPDGRGDARGSAGQISIGFKEYDHRGYRTLDQITPAKGWTAESIRQLFDVWNEWHLNDMRPGCEHQRDWPTTEQVEIVTYQLRTEELVRQGTIKRAAEKQLLATGECSVTPEEQTFLNLPFQTTQAPDADGPGSGLYEVKSREMKALGWLREDKHPRGLLSKPCEECGYRYGSAWRKVEVPADVIEWLRSLPTDDSLPTCWQR